MAVADSRYLAEDALALIDVEYEPLPVLVDPEQALQEGAPLVHDDARARTAPTSARSSSARSTVTSPEADLVVTDRLRWHRSGGQPLETVGAVADFDLATGQLTVHTNSLSFTSYLFMVAGTLKVPDNKLDIRPMPAGGSFGSKLFATKPAVHRGHVLARGPGRPVKYLGGPRRQHLQLRPPRLRPRLRRRARLMRDGDDPRHQDRHRRRLRRLHPVRRRPPRQRARAGRRARTGSRASSTGCGRR